MPLGVIVTVAGTGSECGSTDLKQIADSCNLAPGSYKKMTHEEILEIFKESF